MYRRSRAFTVVELLVVIGIIAILVSILVPVISGVRDQGRTILCQSHLRILGQGCFAFAADHDNRMPGTYFDDANPDPQKRDWLEGGFGASAGFNVVQFAPQSGTLFRYVGRNSQVYLCPALELADSGSTAGPGGGSNGRFDYVAFEFFSGTRLDRLPQQARFTDPATGTVTLLPCPTITEEDAKQLNAGNKDPNHANNDQLSHHHRGGGHYLATDGSVQYFVEPSTVVARYYEALTVRGKWVSIGSGGGLPLGVKQPWTWWESQ